MAKQCHRLPPVFSRTKTFKPLVDSLLQIPARIGVATLLLAAATYLHGLSSLHIMSNGDEMIYA
jgi:hypothetical protein